MIISRSIPNETQVRLEVLGIKSSIKVSYLSPSAVDSLQCLAEEVDGPDADMAIDLLHGLLEHQDACDLFHARLDENPHGDLFSLSK